MLNKNPNLKLYYSIGEVARMFQVNESMLRFWEKEFPLLKPKKAGRGIRQYSQADIDQIRLIHHLVKEQGLTIAGARQRLAVNRGGVDKKVEVLARLKAVRAELVAIYDALGGLAAGQGDPPEACGESEGSREG